MQVMSYANKFCIIFSKKLQIVFLYTFNGTFVMTQGYIIALTTFWLQTYERKCSYTLMELAISYGNMHIAKIFLSR